jgi:hypothetical protein
MTWLKAFMFVTTKLNDLHKNVSEKKCHHGSPVFCFCFVRQISPVDEKQTDAILTYDIHYF